MREGRRSLSGPLTRLFCGLPRCSPTLRRERSRRSRGCLSAASDTSSRSIRSNRRRALRERWSSSTLDKLRLQKLMLRMAPSTGTYAPRHETGAAPRIACPSPMMCELLHMTGDLCCDASKAPDFRGRYEDLRGKQARIGRTRRGTRRERHAGRSPGAAPWVLR